jgi:hypothetical protein
MRRMKRHNRGEHAWRSSLTNAANRSQAQRSQNAANLTNADG